MAQAGQAMNQTSWAGSPQPQVSAEEGWPDQTCHHRTMAGTVKQARATRWKPTVRRPARRRLPRPAADGSPDVRALPTPRVVARRLGMASCTGASTRPSHSSPPPSVLPRPSASEVRPRRVRMIDGVPDNRRCIVVGAGLLGLSAAWALTRRGWDVLVLEAAAAPGHERLGLQGRRPHLPPRLPRAALRRNGGPGPPPLARPRGRDGSTPAPRHRAGDVRRRDDAARHRRRAGGRGRARRAALGAQRRRGASPASPPPGPVLVEPDSGVLAADALPARTPSGGRIRAAHRQPRDVAAPVPGAVDRETADGDALHGRHRRRLRRPGRARRSWASTPRPRRAPVAPPGGLLRAATRRRSPARLH